MACAFALVTAAAGPIARTWSVTSPRGTGDRVTTASGEVQGITLASGVHAFRGIPYAAPPVRDLRWKPPQPVAPWHGVRPADRFAPQCMQNRLFADMVFRNSGMSEDCLYLNVWTPHTSTSAHLPVLVYFYGGGFVAGDGSEPRYDGESLAKRGIVVVTMSYRLGIFGFFAYPGLSAESPHHASGNYALLDQIAALRWVRRNITAFGGDPAKVTIGGESAGSFSVSALIASPLAKGLFRAAIGESGAMFGGRAPARLADAEREGTAFAHRVGARSLADLRNIPAMRVLLEASRPGVPPFFATVDGHVLPKSLVAIYAAGEQAHVPVLVGWNSTERGYQFLLGSKPPTRENFAAVVRNLYGDEADEVLERFPHSTDAEAQASAIALASARFITYGTWKWFELQRRTSREPVYGYLFARPRPQMTPEGISAIGEPVEQPGGAVHSAEIEYALGNLATNEMFAWTADDRAVSKTMESYFANFIKTGDPNGAGLSKWPAAGAATDTVPMIMRIDVRSHAEPQPHRDRFLLLDRLAK